MHQVLILPLSFVCKYFFPLHLTAIPSNPITIKYKASWNAGIFQLILYAATEVNS